MARDGGETEGANAPTVPDDLVAMLDLLAETIVDALGFGVAAVNITRPDGSLEVVSVAGDDDARETLLGASDSAAIWDKMLAASHRWGRLHFLDHRDDDVEDVGLRWTPQFEMVEAPDAWHPEDSLFATLTASDGSRLGILSVDLPRDGLQPGPATRKALEAFAVSTALAIEHATLRTRAEASERRYQQLASHDALTGVGNRSLLLERLRTAVARSPQDRSLMALVFVDLDGFKAVNDRYSHVMGDLVLTTVAQRLRAEVRAHDTVVRWGGDEFLVLLEQLDDEDSALEVVRRLESSVAAPIAHLGHDVAVTASVGVVFHRPDDDLNGEELIRRADAAMYQVKRSGRSDVGVFDSSTDRAVLQRSSG